MQLWHHNNPLHLSYGLAHLFLISNNHNPLLLELFNTMSLHDPSHNGWFMDTDATAHLHSEAGILKKFSYRISCSSILVGDESKIVASKMGDTDVSSYNPYRSLSLKNVLIAPNIINILIYVPQFTNDNSCTSNLTLMDFLWRFSGLNKSFFYVIEQESFILLPLHLLRLLSPLVTISRINVLVIRGVLPINI